MIHYFSRSWTAAEKTSHFRREFPQLGIQLWRELGSISANPVNSPSGEVPWQRLTTVTKFKKFYDEVANPLHCH